MEVIGVPERFPEDVSAVLSDDLDPRVFGALPWLLAYRHDQLAVTVVGDSTRMVDVARVNLALLVLVTREPDFACHRLSCLSSEPTTRGRHPGPSSLRCPRCTQPG